MKTIYRINQKGVRLHNIHWSVNFRGRQRGDKRSPIIARISPMRDNNNGDEANSYMLIGPVYFTLIIRRKKVYWAFFFCLISEFDIIKIVTLLT